MFKCGLNDGPNSNKINDFLFKGLKMKRWNVKKKKLKDIVEKFCVVRRACKALEHLMLIKTL